MLDDRVWGSSYLAMHRNVAQFASIVGSLQYCSLYTSKMLLSRQVLRPWLNYSCGKVAHKDSIGLDYRRYHRSVARPPRTECIRHYSY